MMIHQANESTVAMSALGH